MPGMFVVLEQVQCNRFSSSFR